MNATMEIPRNKPKFDKEYLILLKDRVEKNKATAYEYKMLDDFIYQKTDLPNYILESFNDLEINSFEDYINSRKNGSAELKFKLEGEILGRITGAISGLIRISN